MKRKKMALVYLVAVMALLVCGCGSSSYNEAFKEEQKQVKEEAGGETSDVKQDTSENDQKETTVQAEDESKASEGGSYTVDGISVYYNTSVINDKTGNWRLAVISDGSDLNDYVVDFYKKFVTDDSEVFGIVNLGLRTVTRVSHVMEDWLDVRVTEYRDGEEHDANELYGGTMLKHYWINSETGEIDENLE